MFVYIYTGKTILSGAEYVIGIETKGSVNGKRFYDDKLTTLEKLDAFPTKVGAMPPNESQRSQRRASVLD